MNICLTFLFSTYAEGQTKEAILLDSPQGRECTKIRVCMQTIKSKHSSGCACLIDSIKGKAIFFPFTLL